MKAKIILLTSLMCILFASCDITYKFTVFNKANYPVTIFSQWFDGLESTVNPYHSEHPDYSYQTAFPGEYVDLFCWERWESMAPKQENGYVKIYVMNTDQSDTLCIYYMEDWAFKQTNYQISFPPTEEMRKIKMWPPYGTYDEHGYRISQD